MNKVVHRLKEPSSWAGIAVIGSLLGIKELAAFGVPEIAAALAALVAIFAPEGGKSEDEPPAG